MGLGLGLGLGRLSSSTGLYRAHTASSVHLVRITLLGVGVSVSALGAHHLTLTPTRHARASPRAPSRRQACLRAKQRKVGGGGWWVSKVVGVQVGAQGSGCPGHDDAVHMHIACAHCMCMCMCMCMSTSGHAMQRLAAAECDRVHVAVQCLLHLVRVRVRVRATAVHCLLHLRKAGVKTGAAAGPVPRRVQDTGAAARHRGGAFERRPLPPPRLPRSRPRRVAECRCSTTTPAARRRESRP